MHSIYRFHQLDVFTNQALMGNPLAVVHGADDWSDHQMAQFANWTNLSETTFLQKPTHDKADYKVRIFTPQSELSFAGHPTLGSCYAWLANGGVPKSPHWIFQECVAGLIKIRQLENRLAFAAPALIKSGPLDDASLQLIAKGLGIGVDEIVCHQWVDNGPGFCAVMLLSAEQVLAIQPNLRYLKDLKLGVIGPYPKGCDTDFEVRAFVVPSGIDEDPVTGSLNAGIASWLIKDQLAPNQYIVSQGKALGRNGKIFISKEGDDIWIGGEIVKCIEGQVNLESSSFK